MCLCGTRSAVREIFRLPVLFLGFQLCQALAAEEKRPVTVPDVIRMTRIGEPLPAGYTGVGPKSGFAIFSPDGEQFALVLRKGNLETNTNDYSLLLFRTSDVSRSRTPKILTTFSSASNQEGIFDLSWLGNDTILFLGARGTKPVQLYSIRCSSRKVKQLTQHQTSLKSYVLSPNGTLVYTAEKRTEGLVNGKVLRYGFIVGSEMPWDLVRGKLASREPELFVRGNHGGSEARLETLGLFHSGFNDLALSPDGRYLVLKTDTRELNEKWRQYNDEYLQVAFRRKQSKGSPTSLLRYELIDTHTGRSEVLLDSPAPFLSSDVLWSPDSRYVLLCGGYLPLDIDDPSELQIRRSTKFVVEINVRTRAFVKVSTGDLRPVRWDPKTDIVQFQERQDENEPNSFARAISYRKVDGGWEKLPAMSPTVKDILPDILVDQDLNVPPRIVAVNGRTGERTTILDLNPQFGGLRFGHVEETHWKDKTGNPITGGLYFPPNYVAGRRYPLVIQTHGFHAHEFWLDGPFPTASAAQPLASRGIIVLQINDAFYDSENTPAETERVLNAYESAIDYLDEREIVDRDRVGIVGFSRTCLYVKYALTHSGQRFAAAIASDGIDAGYFQYALAGPLVESEFEAIIGAPAVAAGLSVWLRSSPGFSLDRVTTPVLIQAIEPGSVLAEWEWFSGLKRLNKPVELLYLPTGVHILTKPWDRLVSQQSSVDWFCFWLKAEEDANPHKNEQYARWRELRGQLAALKPVQ